MGLQAAVHLGHMPWALTKEEEEDHGIKIFCQAEDDSMMSRNMLPL
jgi:hypothetical protein